MSRVMVSGSHSSGDDLIRCAYDRCGLELRPKDLKLFIFYLTVRGHDLAFCCGILHADESASETTSTSDLSVEVKKETNYAKKLKVKNAQNERRRNSNKEDHAELIKAFTCAPIESMNTSVINIKNMAANESKKNIEQSIKYSTYMGGVRWTKRNMLSRNFSGCRFLSTFPRYRNRKQDRAL